MIRLYGLMFLIDMALVVVALIDCLSTDDYAVRSLPKAAWVFIILLFSPAGVWRPGSGFPEDERPRSRPLGPDDDPDFLRSRARADDEELFRKWEEDLRRREDDLRRRESGQE